MESNADIRSGVLVLVVGPSGAGKDSLLRYAAQSLVDDPRIGFPRRVITRPSREDVEAHDSMTPEEFFTAREQGRFALHWQAHGFSYALPASIIADLDRGRAVAVNVSRHILAEACRRFSPAAIFNVTAPSRLLRQRLGARGREDVSEVDARIGREAPDFPQGVPVFTIVNDSTIEAAGSRFSRALLDLLQN